MFVSVVVGIFVELAVKSVPAWRSFGPAFLWADDWNPVTHRYGALPMIYGTLVTSAIALGLAATVGVLGAAYLADLAPRAVARPRFATIELLAAVPSVVFGLWGLFVLAPIMRVAIDPPLRHAFGALPFFAGTIFGTSLLTGGIILAIMIVPTVLVISCDVIGRVPPELREASISLGATRWETMRHVVLPAARAGIFGACVLALGRALGATRWETTWDVVIPFAYKGITGSVFLALARALGETMAVTMVVGNSTKISSSLFAPGYSIAAIIANEFTEANGDVYRSAVIELGLVLFALTIVINGGARLLVASTSNRTGS